MQELLYVYFQSIMRNLTSTAEQIYWYVNICRDFYHIHYRNHLAYWPNEKHDIYETLKPICKTFKCILSKLLVIERQTKQKCNNHLHLKASNFLCDNLCYHFHKLITALLMKSGLNVSNNIYRKKQKLKTCSNVCLAQCIFEQTCKRLGSCHKYSLFFFFKYKPTF